MIEWAVGSIVLYFSLKWAFGGSPFASYNEPPEGDTDG